MIYILLLPCCVLLASNDPTTTNSSRWFQQLDQNENQQIELDEVPRATLLYNEFKGVDVNSDKVIDRQEFNRYLIINDLS